MLQKIATQAALDGLNHLLRHERQAAALLRPLAGRTARIEAGPFALQFVIAAEGAVQASDADPDVCIQIDARALTQELAGRSAASDFADPEWMLKHAQIRGDADFARVLSRVAAQLRPDLEEDMSRLFGDAAAVRIMEALRAARRGVSESGARAARQVADYLAGEQPWLASRGPFEHFAAEVNELERAADRLAERTDRLR